MGLAVDQLTLGPVATNCFLVRRDATAADAAVIDPADDAPAILAALERLGARCGGILLTHSHYDHFGALAALADATGAPVWLPEAELDVFRHPERFYAGVPTPPFRGEATPLRGGETVSAAGIDFDVRHVPGHSQGHVSYHAAGALFAGDVLFHRSVGRTDLPFGDWDTLLRSIRDLGAAYPADTTVFPGHGPTTVLGQELAANPFLAELRVS